jgi:hypothetical protein
MAGEHVPGHNHIISALQTTPSTLGTLDIKQPQQQSPLIGDEIPP